MSLIKILPYKMGSKSARALQQALAPNALIKSFKTQPKRNNILLNWGNSRVTFNTPCRVINRQANVAQSVNKRTALGIMRSSGVRVPDFTTDVNTAKQWMDSGSKVLARYRLDGHSGEGIIVMKHTDDFIENPNAPLYVKYLKKSNEFRVHVFNGQVIDYIEKRARLNKPDTFNEYIRSYQNGWVFCRDNATHVESVRQEAIKAVRSLGLDFAAVDVILHNGLPYVLECNTSPALDGTTLLRYKEAVQRNYPR